MRLCLLTANLGAFDPIVPPVDQDLPPEVSLTYVPLTDRECPPRSKTMTPRLQARIPKTHGWELVPDHDAYLWLDASFTLARPDAIRWVWAALQTADVVTFLHPARRTVAEEADFLRLGVSEGSRYLVPRYAGECVDEQMAVLQAAGYPDTVLYGTMLVAYWNRPHVRAMLRDWWYHISRYHAVDQLAFPFVLWQHGCTVATLGHRPYKNPYVRFVRQHHR